MVGGGGAESLEFLELLNDMGERERHGADGLFVLIGAEPRPDENTSSTYADAEDLRWSRPLAVGAHLACPKAGRTLEVVGPERLTRRNSPRALQAMRSQLIGRVVMARRLCPGQMQMGLLL